VETEVLEDVLGDERAGLSVFFPRHDIPDVVEIGRDGPELAAASLVAEGAEDEARAVGARVRVPLAVLGVADRARLLVRGADKGPHALVGLDDLERGPLTLRLDGRLRLRLGAVDLLLLVRRLRVVGPR